jgi:lambda repressor-like predicted transcriptional regulator
MFSSALQTGIAVASIVGASFTAPVIAVDDAPHDAPATAVRAPRPAAVLDTVAEILGVTRADVVATLRTGGTLAGLAVEQGSSGEALAEALLAIADDRIDEAPAAGTIDDAWAADMRSAVAERIDRVVFEPYRRVLLPGRGGDLRRDVIGAVEAELDLPRGRIVSHVRTGGTLAELAEGHGSSGAELVAAMLGVIEERLDQVVADGRLAEGRAVDLLAEAERRLTRVVYEVPVPGRGR